MDLILEPDVPSDWAFGFFETLLEEGFCVCVPLVLGFLEDLLSLSEDAAGDASDGVASDGVASDGVASDGVACATINN